MSSEQLKILENQVEIENEKKDGKKSNKDENLIKELKNRISSELVFVLTGPLCSGLSTVSLKLEDKLKEHNYIPFRIKVSEIIKKFAKHYPDIQEPKDASYSARVTYLQDLGDKIREDYKSYGLANLCVSEIRTKRNEHIKKIKKDQGIQENDIKKEDYEKNNLRLAYVIDSFKHPDEILLLKQIYGKSLLVVGVDCPFDEAAKRAQAEKSTLLPEFETIATRDQSDSKKKWGQSTRKAILESDYFIRNDGETSLKDLENQITRLLELVTNTNIITPNKHETAMYTAYAVASKSACLSRQVGAVITNSVGEIISYGFNDVPAAGGGPYTADSERDLRCFNKGGKCYNDYHKKEIYKNLTGKLKEVFETQLKDVRSEDLEEIFAESKIKDLIEFSRAVHAEMNAIVGVARNANTSTQNTTMYCTTYPCHSCARHIVAAGIKEVFYIEPYAKSLATSLHDDSITVNSREQTKVRFIPYEGVSPKRYLSFFEIKNSRKNDDGLLSLNEKGKSLPVAPIQVDHFYEQENKVIISNPELLKKFAGLEN